ncbi:MAG: alpha/beta hydrolase [Planctomycetota bacterium]
MQTAFKFAAAFLAVASAGLGMAADDIRVERVTFQSHGHTLVGDLYLPAALVPGQRAEAVVVTGAWTTIKEQMSGLYAAELAERGYVALAFDFRTWGESGGDTRSLENPAMKIEDIIAAAEFLSQRSEVAEVNGLGICASAGYMAHVAENSDVFNSIALVAPWLHDAAIVSDVYGGEEGVKSLIETGQAAAASERETGEPVLITAGGPSGSDALMPFDGYYSDPERGMVPEWENTFNVASWEGWLRFDGIRSASGITEPVFIVHSEAAAIPQGVRTFLSNLGGEKQELWLDGVTQFDFYDQPQPISSAVDAVAEHFAFSGKQGVEMPPADRDDE